MVQQQTRLRNGNMNKVQLGDREAHNWYRFVLSYPPHLVRNYLEKFSINSSHCVLDPFCGTGTTLVECKKPGIKSIGIEAHPMTHFASMVKVDWSPNPDELQAHAKKIASIALAELAKDNIEDAVLFGSNVIPQNIHTLVPEAQALILKDSISPLPLHKTLVLLESIEKQKHKNFYNHERLALAQALVSSIGNLRFGPEVGIGKIKVDSEVVSTWLNSIYEMASDLRALQKINSAESTVHLADSRQLSAILAPKSIDAVFTSPPYPNEKDYTRTTRLESVLLGFMNTKADLRAIKRNLMRSNSRNVYVDDTDDKWAEAYPEIIELTEQIERRRKELNKTSGFEKLYARVTKLFFGGMARHLSDLRSVLCPGAMLGYVVGDQASFFQIMIRTGQHIAQIAESLGYEVISIDLFRTRIATATQSYLREEVVILRWPGDKIYPDDKEEAIMSEEEQHNPGLFGDELLPTDEKSEPGYKQQRNRYQMIAERIFSQYYKEGDQVVDFQRADINRAADDLGVERVLNPGDFVYSFRYRGALPETIRAKAPEGMDWVIRPSGRSVYRFEAVEKTSVNILPNEMLAETKVPDATPGIVAMYAQGDEQALLAKLRYNRLIDIFTGVTCYSLQNHLRTTVPHMGQVETDEIYVGVDRRGVHYVFPVQAKGGTDKIGIVQIEQDFALCADKFPQLQCRSIAAQFMEDDLIALFEFEKSEQGIKIFAEKHYRLVPPEKMTLEDLQAYAQRSMVD